MKLHPGVIALVVLGVVALAAWLWTRRPRRLPSHQQQATCPSCGWKGVVSRYAGRCPSCNAAIGEQRARRGGP